MKGRAVACLLAGVGIAACGLDAKGTAATETPAPPAEAGPPPVLPPPSIVADAGGVDADAAPAIGCLPSDDLTSNADHCGACGHSCRGATCAEGVCAPTVVMTGLSSPHGLALGGTQLYVANNNNGDIVRTPKDGPYAAPTLVFATGQAPRALAISGDRLYWPEQLKLRSVKMDGTGDAFRPLVAGGGTAVFVADQRVYFNEIGNGGAIWSAPLDLATEQPETVAAPGSVGIAADSDYVYWTENNNVTRRVRSHVDQSVIWSPNEEQPEAIALGGDFVFWATKSAIRTSEKGATSKTVNLFTGAGRPRALIHDGKNLYWFDTTAKTLVRGAPSGGDATRLTLARNVEQQDFPFTTAIVTDDTWVYWLSSVDNTVKRVPK